MGILTDEMKRMVQEQRLGFVATVSPDGTPNLSPKGTILPHGDTQLVFADIRSPRTIANLQKNPAIEINVINAFSRKGFRFKGRARIIADGDEFQGWLSFYQNQGMVDAPKRIQAIVITDVEQALPVISPGYDRDISEQEMKKYWKKHYFDLAQKD